MAERCSPTAVAPTPLVGDESVADDVLLDSVRAGNRDAYGILYQRHISAAQQAASGLTRSAAERDDLIAEAFARVLESLRNGTGPRDAFRSYLLRTLRNIMVDKARRERRLSYRDDMTELDTGVPFVDTAVADMESQFAERAFASLPPRWQEVLWHTEIAEQSPAAVAARLGLSANGVAALAYRAREGLRQAYLQMHLQQVDDEQCRVFVGRLGAWVRDNVNDRERDGVDQHLAACSPCRDLAKELIDVNHGLGGRFRRSEPARRTPIPRQRRC